MNFFLLGMVCGAVLVVASLVLVLVLMPLHKDEGAPERPPRLRPGRDYDEWHSDLEAEFRRFDIEARERDAAEQRRGIA